MAAVLGVTAVCSSTPAFGRTPAQPPPVPKGTSAVPQPRSYHAIRRVDPIVVDGLARERTWAVAPLDTRFVERQPNLGAAPPVRTSVQVAYDDLALYVLITAESDPGDVIVRTLRRDNLGIFSDDTVYVKLDPTHDRRTGYSFGVNAEGAQIDALGLEDGRDYITQWDGVWSAEVDRRDDGYTVEFRIPFAILGLKHADDRIMGFEVTRDHPSRNATYDWRLIIPPRSPMAASQFGELDGLRNIHGQRAIEYTPYFVARTNFRRDFTLDPQQRPNLATGGDLRVQLGAGSYVEASMLTDFAQVEADEVQVARDRFPLFFPERRPFFINGLEVFNFGRAQEAQLFFSRRIGLVDGRQVPLLGGVKLYGRTKRISYGILHVQTLGSPSDPSRGLAAAVPTNATVGRLRIQANRVFNLGLMVLGEHRFGGLRDDSAAGGLDAQVIAADGRLQWYAFVAGSYAQRPGDIESQTKSHDDLGASAHSMLEYRGLFVRPSFLWLWSDQRFAPTMGFYRRPGASRQQLALEFAPRTRVAGLREIKFGPTFSLETSADYRQRLGQDASASLALIWRNGAAVGYQATHFIDQLQNDFTLYGYDILARQYHGFRQAIEANSPERRSLGVSARYELVNLFGGLAHQPSATVTARIGKHFTSGLTYTHLVGHVDQRSQRFNFGYANGNVDIAFTRNIALDNLLRLDLSPHSQHVGLQSRLRWRFRPGSDVFVAYRMDYPLGSPPNDMTGPTPTPFHELTLKLTYYLRAFIDS